MKLLENLLKFKTCYLNFEEIDKCLNYIKEYYKNEMLYIKEYEYNKDKSIVISNTEDKGLDIIFCGHLDVVPAKDEQFNIRYVDRKAYGRGTFDMKGSVSVMMETVKSNYKIDKKIALILTSDEERGGFNGVEKLLNEEGYFSKVVIVPDAGNNFSFINKQKGVLQISITAFGKEAHSSKPWDGINAIDKLMNIYTKLLNKYKQPTSEKDWLTTISLNKIVGGECLTMVPMTAEMQLDIRFTYNNFKQEILNHIMEIDNSIKVEILAYADMFEVDIENKYIKKYLDCSKKILKRDVSIDNSTSASDARHFGNIGIPCILMNPLGNDLHGDNEYVELDTLEKLKQIYTKYIKEF